MNHQARALLRNRWLQAILLTAFLARAMIPAGFMPGPGGLMLCSGYAPIATADAQSMHDDMPGMDMSGILLAHHSGHGNDSSHGASHDGMTLCPFAAAAGTMTSMPTVHAVAIYLESVPTTVDLPPQPAFVRSTIVPSRLPRGPPSLLS